MTFASTPAFVEGEIEDVVTYPLRIFHDERGWLSELFRNDEIAQEFHPEMAYISFTNPGVQRGPHEHVDQADLFCFIGPSTFNIRLWDNRRDSKTYNRMMSLDVGIDNPTAVIVPKGVVHGYKNIGEVDGMVVNCPNRLYMGKNRSEPVDEIRHEDDPDTVFRMD
ncbi:MAG TPA: dTDP-4-dehydrorhamnose 3,5-epimerase family protein [Pyrinomonadaceae bacterium]|nr:dTDP-4-dehydrorhamnose 3,5-epimerase family protein [Pyrinomonadaceae bacterium]